MKNLVPDLVVRHEGHVYVVDAKYKGHFQELDEDRWTTLSEELRDEHRRDLHQILAYASLYDGAETTAVLVYPMSTRTWSRLAYHGRTIAQASLTGGGRFVNLALVGLPMKLPADRSFSNLVESWRTIRKNAA